MDGYIGFFDILGYQSFLENSQSEETQGIVLKAIESVRGSVPESIKKFRPNVPTNIINETQWLTFSDTIVFAINPNPQVGQLSADIYAAVAVITAQDLMMRMFNDGLPLRGALHRGDYNLLGTSMAGTGVADAIKAGKNLDLATCVLTDGFTTEWSISREGMEWWENMWCEYRVPLSGGEWARRKCLMWFVLNHVENSRMHVRDLVSSRDYRGYVLRSFWSHNKQIGDAGTVRKLEETERFVRYCIFKREELESRRQGQNGIKSG